MNLSKHTTPTVNQTDCVALDQGKEGTRHTMNSWNLRAMVRMDIASCTTDKNLIIAMKYSHLCRLYQLV